MLLLAMISLNIHSQVTISGPLVVIGGGDATYYSEYPSNCAPADACFGEATNWQITGGTITYSDPSRCDVTWDLSGTHRLTMNYVYYYLMSGYWYDYTGTSYAYIETTYQYSKSTLGTYTIDTSTISAYNYVHTIIPRSEYTNETIPASNESRSQDIGESFRFFDGMGRTTQYADIQAGPDGEDMYQYYEFDDFGRQTKKYLPFQYKRNLNTDLYRSNLKQLTLDQYDPDFSYGEDGKFATDDEPWVQTVFDESPLNRRQEQGMVGEDWQPTDQSGSSDGHTQKMQVMSNEASDSVRFWQISNDTIRSNSGYASNELFKTDVKDPDGRETVTYKDKNGLVVLSEVVLSSNSSLKTYYVYDAWNLLRFILPPEMVKVNVPGDISALTFASTSSSIEKFCYYYEYDKYKRLIKKQLPDAGEVYIVYDKRDRIVAFQDENQRNKSTEEWAFTRYDVLNRPIMSGIIEYDLGQSSMQTLANSYSGSDLYEVPDNSASGYHNYTNTTFPHSYIVDTSSFLTVSYFDNYDPLPVGYSEDGFTLNSISGFSNISVADFDSEYDSIPMGRATGLKVKNLETGNWYAASLYYDERGRLIQSKSQNHLSGYDRVCLTYDELTRDVVSSFHRHTSLYDSISYGERFVYDHVGRVLESYHQMSGQEEVLMSALEYNRLGEVHTKYLYSTDTASTKGMLQEMDFEYNIRGWLTAVNDPDNLESDFFAMELGYNDSTLVSSSLGARSFYGGNISAMKWKSDTDSSKAYAYQYDKANRLTAANYGESGDWTTDDYDVSGITYDANGNIMTLTRRDDTQILDSLDYNYSGNRLTSVTDNGDQSDGFSYTGSPANYTYDGNGNLTHDYFKGMSVSYNSLNLPNEIDFGTVDIEFVYAASGVKLQKKINQGTTSTTDYVGNIIYQDGEIQSILTSEGRVVPSGSEFNYEFHLKDHLGNMRVALEIADDVVSVRQIADYYPFGMTSSLYESSSSNDFLYNGKELNEEMGLDWYDYGFRMYDPTLGRWHVQDPLMEKYPGVSPFNYVLNNPLNLIDPFGLSPDDPYRYQNVPDGYTLDHETGALQVNDDVDIVGRSPWSNIPLGGGGFGFDFFDEAEKWNEEIRAYTAEEGRKAGEAEDQKRADDILTKRIEAHHQKYDVPDLASNGGDNGSNWIRNTLSFIGLGVQGGKVIDGEYIRQVGVNNRITGKPNAKVPNPSTALKTIGRYVKAIQIGTSIVGGISDDGYYSDSDALRTSAAVFSVYVPVVGWGYGIIDIGTGLFGTSITDHLVNFSEKDKSGWNNAMQNYEMGFPGACFVEGTKVLLKDGYYRNIEEIVPGDFVLTVDIVTFELEAQEVIEVVSPFHEDIVDIIFSDSTKLSNTADHPFYVLHKGWCSFNPNLAKQRYSIDVKQLKEGDLCFKLENRQLMLIRISSIIKNRGKQKTYNLNKLSGNKNYFVNGVLVHNEER